MGKVSYILTEYPSRARSLAAESPEGPAPMIATFFPLFLMALSGLAEGDLWSAQALFSEQIEMG